MPAVSGALIKTDYCYTLCQWLDEESGFRSLWMMFA
jgi:hypothetical protein